MRALCLFSLAIVGCDASFTDLRPQDALGFDAGLLDAGFVDGGGADASTEDASDPIPERTIRRGTFSGRGSYTGRGSVEIVRTSAGAFEARLGADFFASNVPGPHFVLTTRDRIGARIDPGAGDIDLGAMSRTSGAQTYAAPAAAENASFAWIYCRPFGVEIARAELEEVQ
jgi:hypothetical protein